MVISRNASRLSLLLSELLLNTHRFLNLPYSFLSRPINIHLYKNAIFKCNVKTSIIPPKISEISISCFFFPILFRRVEKNTFNIHGVSESEVCREEYLFSVIMLSCDKGGKTTSEFEESEKMKYRHNCTLMRLHEHNIVRVYILFLPLTKAGKFNLKNFLFYFFI